MDTKGQVIVTKGRPGQLHALLHFFLVQVLRLIRGAPETIELLVCKAIVQEDTVTVILNKEKGVIGIRLDTNSNGQLITYWSQERPLSPYSYIPHLPIP